MRILNQNIITKIANTYDIDKIWNENCFRVNFVVYLSSLSHKIFQPRTHTFWMSAQKTTLLHDVEEWSSEKTEGEKKRH